MVGTVVPTTELGAELRSEIEGLGLGAITDVEILHGGSLSRVNRVTTDLHASVVVKHGSTVASDQFAREALGLNAIRATGVRTPEVLGVSSDWLLLEDIPDVKSVAPNWDMIGRALATMHLDTADAFGFELDTYIGTAPRVNRWDPDGHRFFAEQRLIAPLEWPTVGSVLEPEDRRGVERVAERLRDRIPEMPPALTHGDFWLAEFSGSWYGNVLHSAGAEPAFIDPAVSYCWAEVDLSNFTVYVPQLPERFWSAYVEINPLPAGLLDRLPLVRIHDWLQIIEHTDDMPDLRVRAIDELRAAISRFA